MKLRWAGHVARRRTEETRIQDCSGKTEGRKHSEDPDVAGRIIIVLKMDLREVGWGAWTGSICLRIEREVAGCCECGDELSVSIKYGEFLE